MKFLGGRLKDISKMKIKEMMENKIDGNILAELSIFNVLQMAANNGSIWNHLKRDQNVITFCISLSLDDPEEAKQKLCEYHPDFQITVLQWLLWYVGSGVRAYAHTSKGPYSRKEWAFHKIKLIKENTHPDLWKALVHTPTQFEKKCSTIHFFSRHAYTVEKIHLNYINQWLDDCNGRFRYSHCLDEYGYEPGDYVNFHRKRQELFRKKVKKEVDELVKKYHSLEENIKNMWKTGRQYLNTTQTTYWEWLKEVSANGNKITYKIPLVMRKDLLEAAIARINSHVIHDQLFKDELREIEKKEEKKGRGFSQGNNHLWIIKTYCLILSGTLEGESLEKFAKLKKVDISV